MKAPSPWMVLFVTTAIQVLASLSALAPPVFATEAALDLGVDVRLIGFYTSVVYLGAMLSALPAGGAASRFGALRVSQVSLGLSCLGLLILAGASPVLVLIGALVIGFGYGPITPASSHVLARTTPPERRGLMFSLKQTGVPFGGLLAGVVVPPLVLGFGWQTAAIAVAVAALLLAAAVQPLRAALDSDRTGRTAGGRTSLAGPLAVVWSNRPLRLLSLASFVFAAMQLSLSTFLVAYLVEEIGLDLVTAGLVLAAAQGGGMGGRVLWGVIADRWLGAGAMLIVLALGMAASALVLAVAGGDLSVLALSVLAVVFGATAIGWNGVFLAEVAHLAPPGQAGAATGGALFLTYGGVVAGPAIFGLLLGLPGGYGLAFGVMAAASAASGLLVFAARRSH